MKRIVVPINIELTSLVDVLKSLAINAKLKEVLHRTWDDSLEFVFEEEIDNESKI